MGGTDNAATKTAAETLSTKNEQVTERQIKLEQQDSSIDVDVVARRDRERNAYFLLTMTPKDGARFQHMLSPADVENLGKALLSVAAEMRDYDTEE